MSRYDLALITDARLPGGTAISAAEEIRAQAAAGRSTVLIHLDSTMVARPRPLNPRLRAVVDEGLAEVVTAADAGGVHARLAVLRHPGVVAGATVPMPRLTCDDAVVVVNQPPADATGERSYYDLDRARELVTDLVAADAAWVPIGPQVRAQLATQAPDLTLLAEDWVNIIDVDRWDADPHARFDGERLVIGRHSRPDAKKWPADATSLLAAYPDQPWLDVRVLGGAAPAEAILGALPTSWTVLPFGARPVPRFLAELDAFVYFHHPRWVEAFGRTVLEALASGAVCVLPAHLDELFGDLAICTDVADVPRVLAGLRDRPETARARAAEAQQRTRERFGHATHQRRLTAWLGDAPPATSAPAAAAPAGSARPAADPGVAPTATTTRAPAAGAPAAATPGGAPPTGASPVPARLRRRRLLVLATPGGADPHAEHQLLAATADAVSGRDVDLVVLSTSPSTVGATVVERWPAGLEGLSEEARTGLQVARVGELLDELDVTAALALDPVATHLLRRATATRPQVAVRGPVGDVGPLDVPAAAAAAIAVLEAPIPGSVRPTSRRPSPARMWRRRLQEAVLRLARRLPQPWIARVRAGLPTRAVADADDRIAVPAAGLTPPEAAAATAALVVLRGEAATAGRGDALAALRRHRTLHRAPRMLLALPADAPTNAATTEDAADDDGPDHVGLPIEFLPGPGPDGDEVGRAERRLRWLRATYDVGVVLAIDHPHELAAPAVRAALGPETG